MQSNITVVDHPLVLHKLTLMRDKHCPSAVFRQLLREAIAVRPRPSGEEPGSQADRKSGGDSDHLFPVHDVLSLLGAERGLARSNDLVRFGYFACRKSRICREFRTDSR